MPGGEDWLLRPVLKRCLPYASLLDGTVGLHDIALLNDAMDVQIENERLAEEIASKKAK